MIKAYVGQRLKTGGSCYLIDKVNEDGTVGLFLLDKRTGQPLHRVLHSWTVPIANPRVFAEMVRAFEVAVAANPVLSGCLDNV